MKDMYEFSEKPLYTRSALEVLEEQERFNTGVGGAVEISFISDERDMLEDYLETLEPYNEVLKQAYQDISAVPHPEAVLGRIEDDMDRLARGRHQLLDQKVTSGETRREALGDLLQDEDYDTPVMTDTWIIMNEAEKLRDSL